jgi:peptidoglycan-associated lipoprotein
VLATYQETAPLSSFSATVPVFSQPTPIIADFDGDGKADLIINDRDEVGLINTPLPVALTPGTWAKYVSNSCNNIINFSVPCLGAAVAPSVRMTVEPPEIDAGQSARLCWTSTAGASIHIDQDIGLVGPEGCLSVSPSSSTRWRAVANNCGGEAQTSIALGVRIKEPTMPAAAETPGIGIRARPAVTSPVPKSESWTLEDIFFEYDWYRLTPEAKAALDRNITILQIHPQARVALEATCDERGAVIYNRYLAIARAESAREYLASHGILESRLEIRPQGETTKWDAQHNDAGWALNRRVHFVILP